MFENNAIAVVAFRGGNAGEQPSCGIMDLNCLNTLDRHVRRGRKMKKMCIECGCETEWNQDDGRGELSCNMCGGIEEYNSLDTDTNSSTAMGEERQTERVNTLTGLGPGTVMNPFGDRTDSNGQRLSNETRYTFRRLARLDRSTQRERDPMFRQLVATLQELFGNNLTASVRFLTQATARKLTPEQEAIRRVLSSSEQGLLSCPKTSITRKKKGIKGASDRQNLLLMAIAIAELAHEWLNAIAINRKELLEQHGLTQAQFMNAKSTIAKHYKARCRRGFSPVPHTAQYEAVVSGLREDRLDIHLENLSDALQTRLSARELEALDSVYSKMMSDIGEPAIDAYTSNMAESMLCSSVMLAALTSLGLDHQNLAALGRAVGDRSGAGIKSCLRQLKQDVEGGLFPQGRALFMKQSVDDVMTSFDAAADKVDE